MNIEFNTTFNELYEVMSRIYVCAQSKETFSNKRICTQFNQALNNTIRLLNQDRYNLNKNWQLVRRFVQYKKLHNKIVNIRMQILKVQNPPYFSKKIRDQILPPLEQRIKQLDQQIGLSGRLPFTEGEGREQFVKKRKEGIELINPKTIVYAEKEYFHLLGNYFDKQQLLKKMDIDSYETNYEINSLVSWSEIVKAFIKEGDLEEIKIGKILLSKLEKSTSAALKISYIYNLINEENRDEVLLENNYYQDFVEFNEEKERDVLSKHHFPQTYILNTNSVVPCKVLINEITWDIIEAINELKSDKSQLFLLGTSRHAIAIEISFIEPASKRFPNENYKIKILNTGNGIFAFHKTKEKNSLIKARPMIFHDLPKSAFSYSFISKLIRMSLFESTVDEFYQLLDEVLLKAGGKKDLDSGRWHETQEYGICAYTAVEVWLKSYLTKEQIKHFDLLKSRVAIRKQERIIEIFEKQRLGVNWQMVSRKKRVDPLKVTLEKLEESRFLLQLGQSHFRKIKSNR